MCAAPSPSAPGGCPKLSSQDVLEEIRKAFSKMCAPGSTIAQNDPFCISLNAATDVGDLVKRLRSVPKNTWHQWWSQPPGSDSLLGIIVTAQMLKCLSNKHNSDVLAQVGSLKNWYFDDLLMTVADFKPIKDSGVFTPKDLVAVQTTLNRTLCTGAAQKVVGGGLLIIGILVGVLLTLLIVSLTKKR